MSDGSFTVPNLYYTGAFTIPIRVTEPDDPPDTADKGTIKVTVNAKDDQAYTETYSCPTVFPPDPNAP